MISEIEFQNIRVFKNLTEFGNSIDFFDKERNLKSKGKLNGSLVRIMPIIKVNHSQLKSTLLWLNDLSATIDDDMYYGGKSKTILDLIKY